MNADLAFLRIQSAIEFLQSNYKRQPSLDEIACHVHLSPQHFQRVFTDWAGTSPKKFVQYLSLAHAKQVLKNHSHTVLDAALDVGLSGSSRLHDLFVRIEGMTPGEYKNGGQSLRINYSFAPSPFGGVLVASTPRGICHLVFYEEQAQAFRALQQRFPEASFTASVDALQQAALRVFTQNEGALGAVKLHLRASAFQLKVWEALLTIPTADMRTYQQVAQRIGQPQAARAVGSAIGANPIAYLIPCHRVIQSSGALGGYRWGLPRKAAMLGWEAAHVDASVDFSSRKTAG